jgi:AmiR/NasT family two-component response regulator
MTELSKRLEILVADQSDKRLDVIAKVVEGLGHVVVVRSLEVGDVGPLSRHHLPDVALVGLGAERAHSLEMISRIVHEAACPVIALLSSSDTGYVNEAAKRGVFAYVIDGDPGELQNALDITLRRFAEFHDLEGAFHRRAIIEQAKGILMARNSIDADAAYQLLKAQSQQTGQKMSELALSITQTHTLLKGNPGDASAKPFT